MTIDNIMLSAISSLKLQLHAHYTIGNCGSNLHLLLFDFLKEGCGATQQQQIVQCLQDDEDPKFRLCCEWSKSEECIAKKNNNTKDNKDNKDKNNNADNNYMNNLIQTYTRACAFESQREKKRMTDRDKTIMIIIILCEATVQYYLRLKCTHKRDMCV